MLGCSRLLGCHSVSARAADRGHDSTLVLPILVIARGSSFPFPSPGSFLPRPLDLWVLMPSGSFLIFSAPHYTQQNFRIQIPWTLRINLHKVHDFIAVFKKPLGDIPLRLTGQNTATRIGGFPVSFWPPLDICRCNWVTKLGVPRMTGWKAGSPHMV